MSLRGVIDNFKTSASYSVSRPTTGTMSAGVYTTGTPTTFSIIAIVVPLSGQDLKVLPEGRRGEDSRKVITKTTLQLQDVITIDGEAWEVYRVDGPWKAFGIGGETHCNAMVARASQRPR